MGRDQKATLKVPSAARKRRRAAAVLSRFCFLQLCVRRQMMNSEVGIPDADFALYKKHFFF